MLQEAGGGNFQAPIQQPARQEVIQTNINPRGAKGAANRKAGGKPGVGAKGAGAASAMAVGSGDI